MKLLLASLTLLSLMTAELIAQSPAVASQNGLLARQWVKPTLDGRVVGHAIVPTGMGQSRDIPGATVVLTDMVGKSLVSRANQQGQFTFAGVKPGIHTITVHAPGAFAIYSLHVLDPRTAAAKSLPTSLDVLAVAVDSFVVKSSIARYTPPGVAGMKPYPYSSGSLKPKLFQESIQPGWTSQLVQGGLNGRLFRAGNIPDVNAVTGEMNVFLIHDGEIIDRVISDINGSFRFEEAPVGNVGIFAIGQSGIAVVGFNTISSDLADKVSSHGTTSSTGYTYVSMLAPSADVEIQLAPLESAMASIETADSAEESTDGLPQFDEFGNLIGDGAGGGALGAAGGGGLLGGGAGGGGISGGGGGGGIGGGLGALGALGALAAVAAAASDDDSDPIVSPRPPASAVRVTP